MIDIDVHIFDIGFSVKLFGKTVYGNAGPLIRIFIGCSAGRYAGFEVCQRGWGVNCKTPDYMIVYSLFYKESKSFFISKKISAVLGYRLW